MILKLPRKFLKPEQAQRRQNLPLIRNPIRHHAVKRANPVRRNNQNLLTQVIHIPHFPPSNWKRKRRLHQWDIHIQTSLRDQKIIANILASPSLQNASKCLREHEQAQPTPHASAAPARIRARPARRQETRARQKSSSKHSYKNLLTNTSTCSLPQKNFTNHKYPCP
jgi:hypothetical protein